MFVAALGVRLAYLYEMRGRAVFETLRLDPLYYWRWALRLFEGGGCGAAVFEQSPLYPYLLAGLFRLWGEPSMDLARLAGALVGSLTCVGIARLGRRVDPGSGWIAGLMAAFCGPFVFYDLMIMKTFLAAALTVASTLALSRSEGARLRPLAAAGLLLGLGALVRENLLLVVPFALIWILWRAERGVRLRASMVYIAGVLLATAPAAFHNQVHAREWVWITAGGGEVFYIGNNPQANGQYLPPPFVRPDPEHEHEDFRSEARRRLGRDLTRGEASRYWTAEGWRFIREHPFEWLVLEARKALIFLNAYELPDNYNYQVFRRLSGVLGGWTFGFGAVGPLALVGFWVTRRRSALAPLRLTLAAIFASSLLFFNFGRFRIPAVALLLPFAAATLAEAWRLSRARRWRSLAVGIGAPWIACQLLVNVGWPAEGAFTSAQDHLALAEAHREEGRLSLAEGEYREVLSLAPEGAPHPAVGRLRAAAHAALARLAAERGERAEALEHLGRAVRESPDPVLRAELLEQRARLLWETGQTDAALKDLDDVRALDGRRFRAVFLEADYLRRLGRAAEAERLLRESEPRIPLEDRAARANFHFSLGRLLAADPARLPEALPHLEQVLRLAPEHPQAQEVRRMLASPRRFVDTPPRRK